MDTRPSRNVPLRRLITVGSAFEAKVIAARLGVEGISSQLRGGVDGPYPIGPVHILVRADDLPLASELLLESEVEAVFDEPPDRRGFAYRLPFAGWISALIVLVALAVMLGRLAVLTR